MWLKEGFSSFYENEAQFHFYSNFKHKLKLFIYFNQVVTFTEDTENTSKALTSYVETQNEVLDKLKTFTYYKGAAIIRMFKFGLGAETFNRGIRYYLKQNQYESVETKELHEALQKAYNEDNHSKKKFDVKKSMSKWENYNGYPNISATFVNGTLKLAQMNSLNPQLIYSIPITYSSPSNLNFDNLSTKFWMTTRTIEIKRFSDKWIVFNNQQIGYYKVDYDENLWNGIIDQFNTNHSVINWINRIMLLTKLYDNVDDGKADAKMLFRLMKYIKHEQNFDVIEMAVNPLYMLILRKYKNDKKLHSELRNLFNVYYENVRNDTLYNSIHSMACHLNVRNCTIDIINKMVLDFNNPDTSSNYSISNRDALQHANETIVDMFYDFKKESIHVDKKATFIENLGCIENPKLLEKVLRIYFEDDNHKKYLVIKPPYIEPHKLFRFMLTDSGQQGFLNFLENNLPKLATE